MPHLFVTSTRDLLIRGLFLAHKDLFLDPPEHMPIALKNRGSDKRLKFRFVDPHSGEVRPLVPRQLRADLSARPEGFEDQEVQAIVHIEKFERWAAKLTAFYPATGC